MNGGEETKNNVHNNLTLANLAIQVLLSTSIRMFEFEQLFAEVSCALFIAAVILHGCDFHSNGR